MYLSKQKKSDGDQKYYTYYALHSVYEVHNEHKPQNSKRNRSFLKHSKILLHFVRIGFLVVVVVVFISFVLVFHAPFAMEYNTFTTHANEIVSVSLTYKYL